MLSISIMPPRSYRLFGAALALTHLTTAFFWTRYHLDSESICWAFWPTCMSWVSLISPFYRPVIAVYAALSVFSAGLFLFGPWRPARLFFAALCFLKLLIQLSDYRMMGNYHYMTNIVGFSFAFLPEIENMSRLWLVLFYFSAGIIKFNTDWLSGEALIHTPPISGKALEFALAWAVMLETVLVFLLLRTKRDLVFWWVLLQLLVFHLFSWPVVGYFYPVIMLIMLTAFLIFTEPFRFPRSWWCRGAVLIFGAAQLWPLLAEPDSSLNGRWRLISLNMLDARAVCETRFFLRSRRQTVEYEPDFSRRGLRIACDPLVVLDRLHKTCLDQMKSADFLDIDLDHQVRRSSDASHTSQLTYTNVCSRPLSLTWYGAVVQGPQNPRAEIKE